MKVFANNTRAWGEHGLSRFLTIALAVFMAVMGAMLLVLSGYLASLYGWSSVVTIVIGCYMIFYACKGWGEIAVADFKVADARERAEAAPDSRSRQPIARGARG
jgi:hypothetical protein